MINRIFKVVSKKVVDFYQRTAVAATVADIMMSHDTDTDVYAGRMKLDCHYLFEVHSLLQIFFCKSLSIANCRYSFRGVKMLIKMVHTVT